MNIAELTALLGLSVKDEDFDKAFAVIGKVAERTKEIGRAGKEAGTEASEGFERMHETLEMVEHAIGAWLGVEGFHRVVEMTERVVSQTMSLEHLSERLGISIEDLQGLDAAASVTGTNVESLARAVQHLALGLHGGTEEGKQATRALQRLGVDVEEFKRQGPVDQLGTLADKFSKMADPAQRIAISMQLMGRNGAELIPLLSKGSAELEEITKLSQTAFHLDPAKAEAWEMTSLRLKLGFNGLKAEIADAVLPTLGKLAGVLTSVVEYFEHHEALLKGLLIGIGSALAIVSTALAVFAARTALAKLGVQNLGTTLATTFGQIALLVEGVEWANDHLGKTPAVILAVVGGLLTLRSVLRSIRGEGLISQLGGIGKVLGIGRVGAVAAEGGALAEGGAVAAGGAGLMSLLGPLAAVAAGAYGAYKLGSYVGDAISGDKPEEPRYSPSDEAALRDYRAAQAQHIGVQHIGDLTVRVDARVEAAANADDVARILNEQLDDKIRQAHKDMGGK